MSKIKPADCCNSIIVFSIFASLLFLNAEKSFAQEKNGINEKRKTITKVKDTLIKLADHVYAIISDGEAGNIALYMKTRTDLYW